MIELAPDLGSARIELSGSLTIYEVSEARGALLATLSGAPGAAWSLGLARIDELDTAGVQLLLAAQRYLAASGGSLQVRDCSSTVLELLALLRLPRLCPDLPTAQP